MGQLVVSAAAATVGFLVGGPTGAQIGWAVGGMAYGAMNPQQIKGARLGDLSAVRVEYGATRPIVRGRMRVTPAVLWASAKRELATTESQGKGGGPEVTTYTYEQDVLLELSAEPIHSIGRIWINGELKYTALAGSSDESLAASDGDGVWRGLAVYPGGKDQLPDEVYEAAVGIGRAPAYIGRGLLMIRGLSLGGSGYMPQIEAEVISSATSGTGSRRAGPSLYVPWQYAIGTAAAADSTKWRLHVGQWDANYSLPHTVKVYDLDLLTGESKQIGGYDASAGASYPVAATGNSPIDCLMLVRGTSLALHAWEYGAATNISLPEDLGKSEVRFSVGLVSPVIFQTHVVIGSSRFGSKKLYRYTTTGGSSSIAATSQALPDYVNSILVMDDKVYAAAKNLRVIYVLSLISLDLLDTINRPSFGAPTYSDLWPWLVEIKGQLGLVCTWPAQNTVWALGHDGQSWEQIGTLPGGDVAESDAGWNSGVVGNLLVGGRVKSGLTYGTWRVPLTTSPLMLDLADEVRWLCSQAGLSASDVDASDLEGVQLHGYAITQVAPVRSTLEMLAAAHYFECVESDKLYFRRRGSAPVATLAWDDIGASEDDPPADRLGHQRGNDAEVPALASVSYYNVSDDYQRGAVQSDRLIAVGNGTAAVEIAMALTPEQAQGIADTVVQDARVGATVFAPAVAWHTQPRVEPCDVVVLTDDQGTTYRARVQRETMTGMVRQLECVADDAGVLQGIGVTAGFDPTVTVIGNAGTVLQVLDIPILRDDDDSPGVYAALARDVAGQRWPGAQVLSSVDGSAYAMVGQVTRSATLGTATTALGDWTGGAVFDERNAVTVSVNGALSSVTRDALLSSSVNAALIGDEIVQYRTATLVTAGVYRLSGLLRGRRGTEWAIGTHAAGERVVLLSGDGMVRVKHEALRLGVAVSYKGVTLGRTVDTADAQIVTDTGSALRPFAPVDLRVDASVAGTIAVTWQRRSRRAYRLFGPVPVGEESLAFDVELRDASDVLLDSTSVVSERVEYASSLAVPGCVVTVWQRSAVIGRGYPASITI